MIIKTKIEDVPRIQQREIYRKEMRKREKESWENIYNDLQRQHRLTIKCFIVTFIVSLITIIVLLKEI